MSDFDFFQRFRKNLHVLRVYHGLSTEELSVEIGAVSKKRIIDLEYGRVNPKAAELYQIAKALNVNTEDLVMNEVAVTFNKP